MDDLARHRRFALLIGVVLLTYSLGAEIVEGEAVRPLGIPLRINQDWIFLGLVATSIYSSWVYYFTAFIMAESPMRHRAEIRLAIERARHHKASKEPVDESRKSEWERDAVQRAEDERKHRSRSSERIVVEGNQHVIATRLEKAYPGQPEVFRSSSAVGSLTIAHIPRFSRTFYWLVDLDYLFPFAVNVVALGCAGYFRLSKQIVAHFNG